MAFQFHNFEKVFSDHLTTIPVTLLGSAPKPVIPILQPARPVEDLTPQHSRHALIPSYTPGDEETQGGNVLPKMALDFPRTAIGQSTGIDGVMCGSGWYGEWGVAESVGSVTESGWECD